MLNDARPTLLFLRSNTAIYPTILTRNIHPKPPLAKPYQVVDITALISKHTQSSNLSRSNPPLCHGRRIPAPYLTKKSYPHDSLTSTSPYPTSLKDLEVHAQHRSCIIIFSGPGSSGRYERYGDIAQRLRERPLNRHKSRHWVSDGIGDASAREKARSML